MTFQIFCLAKLNICLKKSFTVKNPFHFICQMSKRMWSANLWNYKLPPTCIRLHTGSRWTFFDQKFVLFFVNSRWSKNLSKTIKNNRNDRKCQKIEKCNFCPVCICVLTMTLKKIVYMTSHFFQDAKLRVISYVSSQWWITTDPNCKFPSSCQVQLSVKKIDISLLLLTLPQQWLQCM